MVAIKRRLARNRSTFCYFNIHFNYIFIIFYLLLENKVKYTPRA